MLSAFGGRFERHTHYGIAQTIQPRIINGTQVFQADRKWQSIVALVQDPNHVFSSQFCGGTLIDKEWVLTAAHCVVQEGTTLNPAQIYAYYGSYDLANAPGSTTGISKIIPHQEYNNITIDHDIALIKLNSPIETVTPIALSSIAPLSGMAAMFAGWGNLSTTSEEWPDSLMEADIPIVDFSTCNFNYTNSGAPLSNNMFCAGYFISNKDSCQGDSGGPLITLVDGSYALTGIVSWGYGCAQDDYPGVYTKVSNYTQWITESINQFLTDDAYEENDLLSSAYDLQSYEQEWLSTINGLGIQSDDDWYKIFVDSDSKRVNIDLRFTQNEGDIDLELYDASHMLLISSKSYSDNEFIDYTVAQGDAYYYIRVHYENVGNSYDLWWDDLLDSATDSLKREFIERFYQNILARASDEAGMISWLDVLTNQSAASVALGFFHSDEFLNRGLNDEDFVNILYQTLFDRAGDSAGIASWLNLLANDTSRESVIYGFLNSQEFQDLADRFEVTSIRPEDQPQSFDNGFPTTGVEGFVNRFYSFVLGRTPDQEGYDNWVAQLNSGAQTGSDIAIGFFFSLEYANRNQSDEDFVHTCYHSFFDREADAEGKASWLNILSSSGSRLDVVNGFVNSTEFTALANNFGIVVN